MKQLLQQCAAYTIWANQKIFDCIINLSDDQINREIVSSFSSIQKTVLHMLDAESAWWQRLKLEEKMYVPSADFSDSFLELVKKVNQQSLTWKEWVDSATEVQLQHVFAYQNTKKEQFKQPVYEMLLHLFNHNTYHRGQLVTMLRQLGVDKIPPTDFSVFCRKK
ncbi:MAG TPA: DinB family protein [Ferruginibacter sp.]|nr:DinB family protein [Ferruginibacter sp.]